MTASVYLCGFMGCGKSHIGRLLAAELGREFVDLDKVIVDREGMSIPEIFEKFGEPHFRSLEAKYIRELSGGYIVATGGGALINDKTAEFARESGISVYINTPFEVCYERIKNDSNRPLVVNNTQEQLRQLYEYSFRYLPQKFHVYGKRKRKGFRNLRRDSKAGEVL